jgi:hypothetical protein
VHSGCGRSAEDAYSSEVPDPTFAFAGGPFCPTLDFVFAFWIIITFDTWLTSLFYILPPVGDGDILKISNSKSHV